MPKQFNPNRPIILDGTALTAQASVNGDRDPLKPFTTQINPNLVMPEHRPLPPGSALGETDTEKPGDPNKLSRRGFLTALGVGALGVAVASTVLYAAPKIAEKIDEMNEVIDGAEARSRITEIAKSIVSTGHTYFSDRLSATAYRHDWEEDETKPYQIDKEAKNDSVALTGVFGFMPYYHAESGIKLSVYTPESPYDGVARTNLEVYFEDKTSAVNGEISGGTATFDDLMTWTESAIAPKDPTKPEDPNNPNDALKLWRVGIFAVDEAKQPLEGIWYAVEITDDAVYVLKPGSDNNQADDENGMRSKDWLSPNDPNYSTAFKSTMAALEKGLTDFTENAKTAR